MILGLGLCTLLGLLAIVLNGYLDFSAITLAIILGILAGNLFKVGDAYAKGIAFAEKNLLSWAVVLMGLSLNYGNLKKLGCQSFLIVVVTILATILMAIILNKLFKCNKKLALLLGIGNAICGSSAIAASNKIVEADEEQVGLSIAVINLLGTLGIFLLPLAASVLSFNELEAGFLSGNALQAVGQVMAAGFGISDSAGETAIIIKMTRVLMLTPLLLILIFFSNNNKNGKFSLKSIPLFIIGFILLSVVATIGFLPEKIFDFNLLEILAKFRKYLLAIAMAGIGLKIKFKSIFKHGGEALALGGTVWAIQIAVTVALIYLLY